jgi:hypothetical protein
MIKKPEKHILKPKKIVNDFTNKPVNTRNTAAWLRGVSQRAKNQHCTHTRDTHFGSTAGKPVPMRYPNQRGLLMCPELPGSFHFPSVVSYSIPLLSHLIAFLPTVLSILSHIQIWLGETIVRQSTASCF